MQNTVTALIAIASELEKPYIREWCEYHKQIGFDRIYVYLNNTEPFTDLDDDYVVQIPFPGIAKQLPSYNDFLKNYAKSFDWCMFLDCDEFLVLRKHNDVHQFFQDYDGYFALTVNWKLFGSSGIEKVEDGNYNVRSRFRRCQIGINPHIKTALNLKKIRTLNGLPESVRMVNPHFSSMQLQNRFSVSTDRRFTLGPFDMDGNDDIAYIAHYATKSKEECRLRRTFVRADCPTPRPEGWEKFFNEHDKNEVEI